MDAKMKEGGNGKRRRLLLPSNPPKIHVSQAIPTPIPKKPAPNYLKPTISSSNEVCKFGSRHSSQHVTPKHLHNVKSPIKPPSPSSLDKKALPGRPWDKPIQPTSTSTSTKTSTKTMVSTKPVSNRKPMSLKNGQNQPLVKAKIARIEAITKERRESETTRSNITSPSIIGKQANTPSEQEKEELKEEVLKEIVKKEVVEHCPLDIPPAKDENFCQNLDSEAGDSTASLEEHEESPTTKEIMDKKGDNGGGKNHHLEEEQGQPNDDGREEHQHTIVNSIASREGEDDQKLKTNRRKSVLMDPGIVDKPLKLEFRQGKVIDNKETSTGESERLKFRKRENLGCILDDQKPISINIALNHQEGREKQEAAAYNDVIEQTASKLVGERRSKVKALVGAFETVISLQDLGSK